MIIALQVLTLLLVAIAMAMALAHALEWPGKKRLSEAEYLAVQPIYYPGFTLGGAVGELGGMVATAALALLTPSGTTAFWLTFGALAALIVMHLLYWLLTAPVNKFWLKDTELSGSAERFFGRAGAGAATAPALPEWTISRDRWERSHALRAAVAIVAFILLATAVAL